MMFAALLGAMTLGACVDNEESQSVTDIRDAKTEELKSQAALNNAQAEAAKILAQADAALKAAEAAYQQALAEQVKAQAEILKIEAEIAAINVQIKEAELEETLARLEATKTQLEANKANYEYQIAQAKASMARLEAQLEVDLARYEADLLRQQWEVINATKDLENAEKINYMALYNEYSNAVSALNSAKSWLVYAQKDYVAAEEGIIADEEAAAETIENYNEAIAEAQKQIALYQTRVDAFAEYVTLTDEELEAKIAEKEAEYFPAYTAYQLANNAVNNYLEANPQPEFPAEVDRYITIMDNWYNLLWNGENRDPWIYSYDVNLDALSWNQETNAIGYYLPNADPYYMDFYPVFEKDEELGWAPYSYDYETVEYTFEGCDDVETVRYPKYSPNKGAWKVNEKNFNAYLKMWGQNLENHYYKRNMDQFLKQAEEMEKKANSTEKGNEGEYVAYKNAVEAYVKAKEAQDAAQKERDAAYEAYLDVYDTVKDFMNPTAEETKALDEAWAAYEKALDALYEAWDKFDEAEATLNDTRMMKEWVEEDIKNIKSWAADCATQYAILTGDYENACATYEELKELAAIADDEKTYEELNNWYAELYASEEYVAYRTTIHEYNEINAEIEALREAYAADDNYESVVNQYNNYIEWCESDIAFYEEQIAALEEAIADPNHEETLAALQQAIELAEARVAAAQKAVDEAKAKLDAALAE